jgi:hypothetical protein
MNTTILTPSAVFGTSFSPCEVSAAVSVMHPCMKIALETVNISLFHRAFHFTKYNGPTNAPVYNKTII